MIPAARSGRRLAVALLCALVLAGVVACSGGDDGATGGGSGPFGPEPATPSPPVSLDGDVAVGTLDSGLTYYVAPNDDPGGRAQLRLVVRAGSVDETPGQSGAAHYLEHMMFNGTEAFPANELTDVLAGFGAQFGPDVNAYTSFDETVYMLEVETDDGREELEVAIDVLAQWASAATLDDDQVEAERGVVLEERRLLTEDARGRLDELQLEVLTAGTPYADRSTLGRPDVLEELSAEDLRDFYEQWYRPERMAVVVAGDVDVEEVVGLVGPAFDDAFDGGAAADDDGRSPADPRDGRPADGRPADDGPGDDGPEPAPEVRVAEDPELDRAHLTWSMPAAPLPLGTVGGRAAALEREVLARVLTQRFEHDILTGDAPLLSGEVDTATGQLLGHDALIVSLTAAPDDLEAAVDAGFEAIEVARRHGVGPEEVERVVAEMRGEVEDRRLETRQDADVAADLVDHVLGYGSMPSLEDGIASDLATLDGIDHRLLGAWLASLPEPSLVVAAPDLGALGNDPVDGLAARADAVRDAELPPRDPPPAPPEVLVERPAGGEVVARDVDRVGTITYRLGNGATVVAVPADNLEIVYVEVHSPGGWSLLDDGDVTAAGLVADIATRSDLGGLGRVAVDAHLAGTSAEAEPYVDEFSEGIEGAALPDDLEVLLQLEHLYLSDVALTDAAARVAVGEARARAATVDRDADLAAAAALGDAYYSGSARHRVVPTVDELDAFDLERAQQIYDGRFADAADLTVVVVGTFDPDEVGELAAAYIGTLPSAGRTERWVDRVPAFPREVVRRRVEAGTGQQASVQLVWELATAIDARTDVTLDVVRTIADERLTKQLREALGATYSPVVDIADSSVPRQAVEAYVRIDGAPSQIDDLATQARRVLVGLGADGPTEAELERARAQLHRDYELSNAYQRAQAVIEGFDNSALGLSHFISGRAALVEQVDAADVRTLAAAVFADDASIEVIQVPSPR